MRTYLGLAWASVRHRPGGWLLLALGVALATALPVISAGLRAESSVAAVRSVIDGLPPAKRAVLAVTFRDVRGTALADVDHSVRAGFSSAGITDVNRALTFRPLSAGALTFTLGGVDGLPGAVRLTSGRLPAGCQPTSCEVVVVTVPGGAKPADSYDRAARQLGLVVTGTAELLDQRPTGTGLIAADTPLLLAADPTGLADLESLSLFGRNTAWYGTLDGRSIASLGAARFTRVLADISESVNASSGPLTINWPSDAVIAASDRATAGADQLAVLGAGSGSLLLGFGIVVAAGMRRRQQLVGRLLTRRGASTRQILVTTAIQPLFAVVVGVLAGAAAGVVVVGWRGRELLAAPWAAAVEAVRSEWPALLGLALAAIVITVAVARWPEESGRSTQLVVDAALLAAVAATVLIVVSSSQGSAGPLTASVVVLLTVATGLVAARLWRPLAALASRRRPAHITWAAALAGGRRRPLLSMVTAAFVAAACCSLVFAGAYQQSLRQSALDQAAQQVPLDVSVSPSAQVAVPSDVVDAGALRAISDQVQIYPVVSSTVTAFAGSSLASALPLTGIDPQALPAIHEFAATTGTELSRDRAGRPAVGRQRRHQRTGHSGGYPAAERARPRCEQQHRGRRLGGHRQRARVHDPARRARFRAGRRARRDPGTDRARGRDRRVRLVPDAPSARGRRGPERQGRWRPVISAWARCRPTVGRWNGPGPPGEAIGPSVSATEDSLSRALPDRRDPGGDRPGLREPRPPRRRWPWPSTPPPPPGRARPATSASPSTDAPCRRRSSPCSPGCPGSATPSCSPTGRRSTAVLSRIAPGTAYVSQLWIAAPDDTLDQVRAALAGSRAVDGHADLPRRTWSGRSPTIRSPPARSCC